MVKVTDEFQDFGDREVGFREWASRLPVAFGETELERLERAWHLALTAYRDYDRESGEPYFSHALAVATILGGLKLDVDSLAAGLLHDLPWFDGFDAAALAEEFGDEVASLVQGSARMGLISELHDGPQRGSGDRAEGLRKMLLAMARDIRVVFIVLAERLHDMRMLKRRAEDVQRRVARETLDLFAPLANRLGLWQLKWELEDQAFRVLEPIAYKRIARLLAEKRVDRERYVQDVQQRLSQALTRAGIAAEITGRPKHIYSIWRKMQRKGLGFHELFDIRAFRVLVDTIPQCYAALGTVHALWQPIPREFDDYIATPKENNYQSLHTAVVGPEGQSVEIQIRTREMHQQAELGIAAHWRYKEGGPRDPGLEARVAWLRQLLEWGQEEAAGEEFIDRFKSEVFEDRVYVLTPQGDVLDLPRGATPLDFAYQVHSQVGHRCRGAKVNGRMVPLTYQLRNGDRVEVLTARNATPSRDWLNPGLGYLVTPKARAKARSWFRQQDFDKNAAEGRTMLDRELHRLGLSEVNLERLAGRSRFPKVDEFLAAIGRGDITGGQIAGLLGDELLPPPAPAPELPVRRGDERQAPADEDISIYGVGNLLTRLARCCRPAPGDAIIGFITQGQGVSIHRCDCPNVRRLEETASQRLIEVSWNRGGERRYPVEIQVDAYDRQGLVRDITALLGNEHINVLAVTTRTDPDQQSARMTLTLQVTDVTQMSRVMDRIAGLRNVRDVHRVSHR